MDYWPHTQVVEPGINRRAVVAVDTGNNTAFLDIDDLLSRSYNDLKPSDITAHSAHRYTNNECVYTTNTVGEVVVTSIKIIYPHPMQTVNPTMILSSLKSRFLLLVARGGVPQLRARAAVL